MRSLTRRLAALTAAAFILCSPAAAALSYETASAAGENVFPYSYYTEVPGVGDETIRLIEELKRARSSFTYATIEGGEGFAVSGEGDDMVTGGYSRLFCDFMSGFFGVTFKSVIRSPGEIYTQMPESTLDFTGELPISEENLAQYTMSENTLDRSIVCVRTTAGEPLDTIARGRELRYGYIGGSATTLSLLTAGETRVYVTISYPNNEQLIEALLSGYIDAVLFDSSRYGAAVWSSYPGLRLDNSFPFWSKHMSFATKNPELKPFIDVINEALENGLREKISYMYADGQVALKRFRFSQLLTEEERAFVNSHIESGEPVKVSVYKYNYPQYFYNEKQRTWQGAGIETLEKISDYTGITFEPVNMGDGFVNDVAAVEAGDLPMSAGLQYSTARAGRFLWAENAYYKDFASFISDVEAPNYSITDLSSLKVGVFTGSATADIFNSWFAAFKNEVGFSDLDAAFAALGAGGIDLLFVTESKLLYQQNYKEDTGFRVNIALEKEVNTSFAFNRSEDVLRGIVSKAQRFIDTYAISQNWQHKVFDYGRKQTESWLRIMLPITAAAIIAMLAAILLYLRGLKLRDSLKRAVRSAVDANDAKTKFLSVISHEIRTPLNAIIGLSFIQMQNEENLPEEAKSDLERIHASGTGLLAIVNDILDMSKMESGKFEIIPMPYDTESFFNDTIELNIVRIESKPIKFVFDCPADFPSRLNGDEIRVKQILNNLLSNAFKYTREGLVRLGVSFRRDGDEAAVTFVVSDTGAGISEKDMDSLFTEFTRIEAEKNRAVEGTGLGLAITKRLAEVMGGSVSVDSEYGKGSTFTVVIRQGVESDTPIGAEAVENLRAFRLGERKTEKNRTLIRADMSYARVLIVDDVPTNLHVAKGLMMPYRIKTDTALSGREAIERIKRHPYRYDAVFMDHMMPEIDGVEATRIIRAMESEYARNIPIIALTANAMRGNREMFLGNGFTDFISKPIDIMRLDAALNEYVRDKERESGAGTALLPSQVASFGKLKLTGVDVKQAVSRYSGYELYIDILKTFASTTPEALAKLKAPSGDDPDEMMRYGVAVHGLKGAAYGICANALGDAAYRLEKAARSGDAAVIARENEPLVKSAESLIEEINAAVRSKTTLEKRKYPDKAQLKKLKAAAENFNAGEMERILGDLEKYEYEFGGDLLELLRHKFDDIDYDGVISLIED